jgi:hypothetical protein
MRDISAVMELSGCGAIGDEQHQKGLTINPFCQGVQNLHRDLETTLLTDRCSRDGLLAAAFAVDRVSLVQLRRKMASQAQVYDEIYAQRSSGKHRFEQVVRAGDVHTSLWCCGNTFRIH